MDLARRPGLQVPEFAAQHQAALGVVRRRDGGVTVRGDVPVPGRADLESAVAALADARRQKARQALAAHREAQPGGVEHRHVGDRQPGVGRRALVFFLVDGHRAGVQPPDLLAGVARGQAHVVVAGTLGTQALGAAGVALEVTGVDPVGHRREAPGVRVQVHPGLVRGDHRTGLFVVDVAAGAHALRVGAVLHALRGDLAIRAPDHRAAGEHVASLVVAYGAGVHLRGRVRVVALGRITEGRRGQWRAAQRPRAVGRPGDRGGQGGERGNPCEADQWGFPGHAFFSCKASLPSHSSHAAANALVALPVAPALLRP